MEQQLVVTEEAKLLAKSFEERLKEILEYGIELRSMDNTLSRANLALERSKEIRRYLEDIEASPLRELARRMNEAHKFMTALLNRVRNPAQVVAKFCTDCRSEWEIERRRRNAEEQHKREELANRLAAEQRAAEIKHLEEIGRQAEAQARAAAPVIPVSVSIDPNAGKPQGEIMVEVWVPKLDEQGEIVFSDETAYRKWNAERPEFHYLMKHEYGKLKKLLSDNRGMLQPPGLEIEHKFEARTRSSNE